MTAQEQKFFNELITEREMAAKYLGKSVFKGVRNGVVEKYSTKAHFVYELLQNADDAKATTARFVLYPDKLVFSHNGKRHFSISDPANEDADSDNHTLGDINSITSIGNSTKEAEIGQATIGKFGVGFKAVFQYTDTPYIYDPNFRFKIEKLIIPRLVEEDYPEREDDETLFVFPFNCSQIGREAAFKDISDKLRKLSYPILFLNNLERVSFKIGDNSGVYSKKIKWYRVIDNTEVQRLVLNNTSSVKNTQENLLVFSRTDKHGYSYSVGYFLDENEKLVSKKMSAFCFFLTNETTNLKFIIQAPFLLTDSREGIRAGVKHNEDMVDKLATLAADSILILRDMKSERGERLLTDRIIDIIPTDKNEFSENLEKSKISFLPFYERIKDKFETEELIPTMNGYVKASNAYWASTVRLTQLFSNSQLADIVSNQNAEWVFCSMGRDDTDRKIRDYLDDISYTFVTQESIINGRNAPSYFESFFSENRNIKAIKGISKEFIEKQQIPWLHIFYKWISETKQRTDLIRKKPIFLDQDNHAVAAYDENNQLILFLPTEGAEGYTFVNSELLKDQNTSDFIKSLGVKPPSLWGQIYNKILPLYKGTSTEITPALDSHFKLIFKYYCDCSSDDKEELIENLRGCSFLICSGKDGKLSRKKASEMYFPTQELRDYFKGKDNTCFLDIERYNNLIEENTRKHLEKFFIEAGVLTVPMVNTKAVDPRSRKDLPHTYSTQGTTYEEPVIDGCKKALKYCGYKKDKDLSLTIWNILVKLIVEKVQNGSLTMRKLFIGYENTFYYKPIKTPFDSSTFLALKKEEWLCDKAGNFKSTSTLFREDLSDEYDTTSIASKELINYLGIKEKPRRDDSNLSDEQKADIDLGVLVREAGVSKTELIGIIKAYQDAKEAERVSFSPDNQKSDEDVKGELQPSSGDTDKGDDKVSSSDNAGNEDDNKTEIKPKVKSHKNLSSTVSRIIEKVEEGTDDKPSFENQDSNDDAAFEDDDEFIPSSVDYTKKIERAERKSINEIQRINYLERLQSTATSVKRYSYLWFKTLLEMECITNQDKYSSKTVSLSFSKVEKEPNKQRTLILKRSNRGIPQFIEDLGDIPLVLHMNDKTQNLSIEVANIQSFNLRVKIKGNDSFKGIDFNAVTQATIDVESPDFLLKELEKSFKELPFADDYDMQRNLCGNIKFIFGPPGTGKTTYLATNVLMPLMRGNINLKVLVLTPTNKAADVLVKKIMEASGSDESYKKWLIRFGSTGDEDIENNSICKDRLFNIYSLSKSVTVTTIARFPYDFFHSKVDGDVLLKDVNWDYIVIDEASMIPLANIIYPLYKKKPREFIIAGDPFQIQPITSVSLWKNENIYTLVKLNSFTQPSTINSKHQVELLMTQYRSVPVIGSLFSEYTYGGKLNNYRDNNSQRQLHLDSSLGIQTVNIIRFPVSKYESIYRCKRLNNSNYQVYSALFTFEYVSYLSKEIAKANKGSRFRIGVIAPYRAQADMIDKLLSSETLPREIDVQVGTIHGFQGDECDIIFTVFNTPPTISSSPEMFLNNRNIINVAISRARDYLFIIMPDDDTENIDNLGEINNLIGMLYKYPSWKKFFSSDLEELIFNDPKYLENNAFSTSHQSVNVYGVPESRYEIRTEDSAVDVQIHRGAMPVTAAVSESVIPVVNNELDRTEKQESSDTKEKIKMPSFNAIPIGLRKNAKNILVTGAYDGCYSFVFYSGKVKNVTSVKMVPRTVVLNCEYRQKRIPITVDESNRIIYMTENNYNANKELILSDRYVVIK